MGPGRARVPACTARGLGLAGLDGGGRPRAVGGAGGGVTRALGVSRAAAKAGAEAGAVKGHG